MLLMSYLVTPRYPNSILPMGGGVLPKHIEVRDPGHSQHWVCLISRVHGSIRSPDLVISGSGISDPLVGRSRPRDLDLGFLVSVVLVVYGLRIRVPYPYVCMATDILHYAYSGPRMDHAHGRAYVHLLIWSRHLGIWGSP